MTRQASTVSPDRVPPTVQHCIVCFTLNRENLLTTQKPESLGSEQPIPPAHIASPITIGETPDS